MSLRREERNSLTRFLQSKDFESLLWIVNCGFDRSARVVDDCAPRAVAKVAFTWGEMKP